MKRLFTFGCSLTNWIWPTWADIYATEFDFFENWGMPSAGNLYIFNSIVEANKRHKFTINDTIVIMWSGMLRIDNYHHNRWHLYEESNDSIRGSEIVNFAYIEAIDDWFKSKNLNYTFLSLLNNSKIFDSDVYEFYKDTIDNIKPANFNIGATRFVDIDLNDLRTYSGCHRHIQDLFNDLRGPSWPTFEEYIEQYPNKLIVDRRMETLNQEITSLKKTLEKDNHPTPIQHLESLLGWAKDFTPNQSTIDWIYEYEELITKPKYVIYSTKMPEKKIR